MTTKTITILQDGHIHDGRELKAGETLAVDSHLADFLVERGTAAAAPLQQDGGPAAEPK